MQQPFSNIVCYCELAESPLFFETLQSCVSTKVTLSHRFKSSPAISGKVALSGAAGYMMMAGHFCKNLESSGDLNRGSQGLPRVLFGYFLHDAKSNNPYSLAGSFEVFQTSIQLAAMAASLKQNETELKPSQREIRGSANLESAHQTTTSHEPN